MSFNFKADGIVKKVRMYPRDTEGANFIFELFTLSLSGGSECGSLSNPSMGTGPIGAFFEADYTPPLTVPTGTCELIATGQDSGTECRCPITLTDPDDCVTNLCCPKIDSIKLGPLVAGETLTGEIVGSSVNDNSTGVVFTGVSMPAGTAIDADGMLSGTLPQAGTYQMQLSMNDGELSCGTIVEFEVTQGPESDCPVISAIQLPALVAGEAFTGFVQATSDNGDVVFTEISFPDGVDINADGEFSGTVPGAGVHQLVVGMSDDTTTCTANINIVVVNESVETACPAVTGITLNTLVAGEAIFGSLTAQSQNGGNVTFALKDAPTGWEIDPDNGNLTGTAPAAGDYSFVVTTSDGSTACDTTISYQVQPVTEAPCPRLTLVEIDQLITGGVANGGFQAEGEGDVLFSASGVPAGLQISETGTLSGTVPADAGRYRIVLTLTDDNRSCNTEVYLNTYDEPETGGGTCPLLNAVSIIDPRAGESASGSVSANGNGVVRYSSEDLPAGVSFTTTGEFSGTWPEAGTYPITIEMVDDNEDPCSFVFSLVVCSVMEDAQLCPKLGSAFLPTAYKGEQYAGLVAMTGVGDITYSMTQTTGLSISSTTGQISGTFTANPGNHTETLTVTDDNGSCDYSLTFLSLERVSAPAACPRLTSVTGLSGKVDQAFTGRLVAVDSEGNNNVVFSVLTGKPPGIEVGASGVISGSPTVAGSYPMQLQLSDAGGNTCNVEVTFYTAAKDVVIDDGGDTDQVCDQLKAIFSSWKTLVDDPNASLGHFMSWVADAGNDDDSDYVRAFEFWQKTHCSGGTFEDFLVWINNPCPSQQCEPIDYCVLLLCNKTINDVDYYATPSMPALVRVERSTRDQLIANGEATMAPIGR